MGAGPRPRPVRSELLSSLDEERVARLISIVDTEVSEGRMPTGQLALAHGGEVVVRHTAGAAPDARYTTFSVTKAVTCAATWLYLGKGLTPTTRVVDLLPEFTGDGKDAVTLEHLLTHTAGFPFAPMTALEGGDAGTRRAKMAGWRVEGIPGESLTYHATSAHWVVATMLDVVSGQDFRTTIREQLLEPLGLTSLSLGATDAPVLDVVRIGTPGEQELPASIPEDSMVLFNDPAVRAAGVPGGGAVSTADDIALLYQALLHNPGRLWDPAVLSDGTGHVRTGDLVDPWTKVPALRTLGLTVAGDDGKAAMRQFGRGVGPRAFGASGLGGQMAWADPDTGLSFCFLTNGLDRDQVASFVRSDRISTAAARCVPATT
ncbi:MAG: penicillin-binding protein beta-lactamase class [Frankiales bacterium]|nr:penicillin-binding protein beta-lactamase class [Frankiales bacterium]